MDRVFGTRVAGYLGHMGFDLVIGVIVVLAIAFLVLGAIFIGRRGVKTADEDEGVNASRDLTPHDGGHVGRVESSDAENRGTAV